MRVLLISAHADDVEVGAGGTVAKFKESGAELFWVVFSVDVTPEMKKECFDVLSMVGPAEFKVYDYKYRYFPEKRQKILQHLVDIKEDFKPELVICPSPADIHQDHRVVGIEALRAYKRDSSIIAYELPWNFTDFKTIGFSELKDRHLRKKLDMVMSYKSQTENRPDYFSEDFISSMAKMRGVQAGFSLAEAFEVLRWRL